MLRSTTLLLLSATVLGTTAARPGATRAPRAVARVQLTAAQRANLPRGAVLLYAEGPVAVTLADGRQRLLNDTLRLMLPVALTADLTDGALHVVRADSRRDVQMAAKLTGAPALRYDATASHVVLERGGVGVHTGG